VEGAVRIESKMPANGCKRSVSSSIAKAIVHQQPLYRFVDASTGEFISPVYRVVP
jgi:hypothetical protein